MVIDFVSDSMDSGNDNISEMLHMAALFPSCQLWAKEQRSKMPQVGGCIDGRFKLLMRTFHRSPRQRSFAAGTMDSEKFSNKQESKAESSQLG